MPQPAIIRGLDNNAAGLVICGVATDASATYSAADDVETTLHSYTMPANSLLKVGDGIEFYYHGNFAATAGSTTSIDITLGAVDVYGSGLFQATTGGGYLLHGRLFRAASGQVVGYVALTSDDKTETLPVSIGPDLETDIDLVLSGTGHTANDVSKLSAVINFRGQAN